MKKLIVCLVMGIFGAVVIAQECVRPIGRSRDQVPFVVADEFWESNSFDVMGYKLCLSGGHYVYKARGCQKDGMEVGFEVLEKPDGMVYDPNSNEFEWYPKTEDIGEHWLVMRTKPIEDIEIESDTVAIILRVRYGRSWFCSLEEILTE